MLLLFLGALAHAHVVSMSSGEIAIQGTSGHYELRMPLYEVAHVQSPERTLLDHIRFRGATRTSSSCTTETAKDSYICSADYTFAAPIDRLEVECTFAAVTVPNHVHMLRAELDGKTDQAVFDAAFPRATLLFRPPTAMEIAVTQSASGFARALGGVVQVLFLAAIALAGRSRKELAALVGTFLAGQAAALAILPRVSWQPAPRFVESAMALALAYLAIEILLLPEAGARWAVAGILGVFQGMYFDLFAQSTGYRSALILLGAVAAEAIGIGILALAISQLRRFAQVLRPVQVSAAALLVFGMAWFFLRLRG